MTSSERKIVTSLLQLFLFRIHVKTYLVIHSNLFFVTEFYTCREENDAPVQIFFLRGGEFIKFCVKTPSSARCLFSRAPHVTLVVALAQGQVKCDVAYQILRSTWSIPPPEWKKIINWHS